MLIARVVIVWDGRGQTRKRSLQMERRTGTDYQTLHLKHQILYLSFLSLNDLPS